MNDCFNQMLMYEILILVNFIFMKCTTSDDSLQILPRVNNILRILLTLDITYRVKVHK